MDQDRKANWRLRSRRSKMPRKTCGLCGKSRPVKSFHKRTISKDGLQPYCKACRKEDNYGKR